MKKLILVFLVVISAAVAQAQRGTWENGIFILPSELTKLDGEWYSNQWKYGYTLTNGVGVATSTNSPNFKVGDRIIFLQQSSDKTFEGTQVYTDGKFYKITAQLQSNDTLLFKGEKNISWTMTKKTQTTAQSTTSTTSTTASSVPQRQSNLPQCQGTNISKWNMCFGAHTYPDGRKFFGEWKDGKRNGQGTTITANGSKYIGGFKDDLWHGRGTWENSDGSKYVGEFKGDKGNGQGTYTFPNGEKHVGEYKDGKLNGQGTLTFPDGAKYVGEFKDDKPNGQGTRTSSNGTVLQAGRWINGIFVEAVSTSTVTAQATTSTTLATSSPVAPLAPVSSAPPSRRQLPPCQGTNPATWNMCFGKDTAPDPVMPTITRTYVGEYKDGKPHGTGTETFPNGAKYVGGFIGGKRNGQGTATYSDGSKYVGEWRNGSRNGQGTHTFSNGEKYVGEIKDGNRHGQGTLTLTSGATETGTWREGRLISMAELAPVNSASTTSPSTTGALQVKINTTSTATAQTLPPSTTSSIAEEISKRKLPPCQGEQSGWDMCFGQVSFNDNSWSGEFMRGGSGQWTKGALHRGTRTESDGFSYVGNHNGQFGLDGPFTVSFTNGRPQPAIWKNNNIVSVPTNLPKCQGNEVSNWNMCLGVEKVTKQYSITEYVGEFKDGKYDGYGVLLMTAGRFYLGQFKDGKYHGYGIYTNRPDKRSYDGEWIDGKRNGRGSYIAELGIQYTGQWKDDKRNGNGTEFRQVRGKQTSKTYVGAWQDDQKNGQGTYTRMNDGSTGTGEWFKGNFVIATRENISKFNDDVVAQALSYVSGLVLNDIDKSTRSFFISNNAETNRPCTYELVVDPTSDYKAPRVQIDLNKGNPSAIQFFTQDTTLGQVYISRVEGLPEFKCNGCNGARVQRAWALIYKECKGTRKAF